MAGHYLAGDCHRDTGSDVHIWSAVNAKSENRKQDTPYVGEIWAQVGKQISIPISFGLPPDGRASTPRDTHPVRTGMRAIIQERYYAKIGTRLTSKMREKVADIPILSPYSLSP